jgi:hypothetical protein
MKRYESKWNILFDIVYGLFILWILLFQWNNVMGNLEASAVWGYPASVAYVAHFNRKMENNKNDN